MDAIKYLKEADRMCRSMDYCDDCPFNDIHAAYPCNNERDTCDEVEKPDKLVELVKKWSEEHPKDTRQSKFLKLFPNAKVDESNIIDFCPTNINQDFTCREDGSCMKCKKDFWLEELE